MNFLAHIFLSCKEEDLLIGNFLTDFLNKKETESLAPEFQAGVALHRRIDLFTDKHPKVLESVRLLYPKHSKYSSVLIDIFSDYFLIQNWNQFSSESLEHFTQKIYKILKAHIPQMPEKLHVPVNRMVNGDWLRSYGTEKGIKYSISGLARRASRPDLLEDAFQSLEEHQIQLNQNFLSFFPDIIKEVECFC